MMTHFVRSHLSVSPSSVNKKMTMDYRQDNRQPTRPHKAQLQFIVTKICATNQENGWKPKPNPTFHNAYCVHITLLAFHSSGYIWTMDSWNVQINGQKGNEWVTKGKYQWIHFPQKIIIFKSTSSLWLNFTVLSEDKR